jgi:GA4 desaturase
MLVLLTEKEILLSMFTKCLPFHLPPHSHLRRHKPKTNIKQQPGVNGNFLTEVHMLQGKNAASQKWSFIREQKPDEVLFIQFFDSHADKEGKVLGTPHGSPVLIGSEEEELRESVGSVVIALLLRAGR